MRLVEIHTCPVWENFDGHRTIGMEEGPDHPPVVGWCNVIVVEINGQRHELLAANGAQDGA